MWLFAFLPHPPTFTGIMLQSDGSDGGRVLYLQLWGFTQRKRRVGGKPTHSHVELMPRLLLPLNQSPEKHPAFPPRSPSVCLLHWSARTDWLKSRPAGSLVELRLPSQWRQLRLKILIWLNSINQIIIFCTVRRQDPVRSDDDDAGDDDDNDDDGWWLSPLSYNVIKHSKNVSDFSNNKKRRSGHWDLCEDSREQIKSFFIISTNLAHLARATFYPGKYFSVWKR